MCIYTEISAIPFLLHRDIDQNGCCSRQRFTRFYRCLDVKEKDTSLNTKVCNKEEEKEKETDVWQDIATPLADWTRQILDTESRRATSENFRQRIEETLNRQQLDRFLTAHDLTELRYIADL